MNETLLEYIKKSFRRTCYQHKYYLREFKIVDGFLYIKVGNKDKQGFNTVIEKEYPLKNLVQHLTTYKQELVRVIKRDSECFTDKQYNLFVEQSIAKYQ